MSFGVDDAVKNEIENLKEGDGETQNRLVVLLETTGGYVETVERIVGVFRRHYKEVEFVIPNFAYSAGTILVMSGDEIHMNYYSILGPIDPQFETESGPTPGMGYLAKYNELMSKINSVPDDEIGSVRAEMALLLKKFDPGFIFSIEQATKHSQELIEGWLPRYKFKNWKKTKTRGIKVDDDYKMKRAKKIARALGNAEHWHSHGRGISMENLAGDDIGLEVNDFGSDPALEANITHYHGLLGHYMRTIGVGAAIHTVHRLRRIT